MHPFEKLLVWQRANIAEGAGGDSQRHFARFVGIALASAAEVRCLMLLARDVGLLPFEPSDEVDRECEELRRMLTALRTRVLQRANSS